MPSLKIGDVVQLRSGGPTMTVVAVTHVAESDLCLIDCGWFTSEMRPEKAAFPEEALERWQPTLGAAEIANRLANRRTSGR